MKYLVTGAAGFLGFHLAAKLSTEPNAEVICVDNFSRGERDELYAQLTARSNVHHISASLTDVAQVNALPSDIDVLYHLAALNGTQNFYERPFEVVRSCTLPTLHLLEKYGPLGRVKRFIYAGTSESYAFAVRKFGWEVPTGEEVPVGVEDVFNPRWSYAGSKMHGEIATVNACRQFGLPYTIVRYHNAYGPRMGDKHVIPDFLNRAKEGKFALYGHEETRTFIYVDDAVRATIALGSSARSEGQVVNLGGTHEISMHALAKEIMKVCGFSGEIELHGSPSGSVYRRAPKLDKLIDLIGFQEEWTLVRGLKRTADFYLAGRFSFDP